jgi:hypothetical protein
MVWVVVPELEVTVVGATQAKAGTSTSPVEPNTRATGMVPPYSLRGQLLAVHQLGLGHISSPSVRLNKYI